MKELIKSVPLLLFLSLLLILSISIYFGDVKKYANLEGHTSKKSCDDDECDETNTNDGDNKQFVDDLKIIMSTIAGTARNNGNTVASSPSVHSPSLTTSNMSPPTSPSTLPAPTTSPMAPSSMSASPSPDWFTYWNTVANSNDPSLFSSSNMIPKTQIVPPVCPQCPQNVGGACTNCGGFGGSGTSSKCRNTFADFLSTYGSGYKGNGDWAGIRGRDYYNNTSLGQMVENTGSETVGLLRDAGSGSVGLLRDATTGSVGLLRDATTGSVGLLRDATTGSVGLLRDAGSGTASLLKSNPTQLSQINGNAGQPYGYVSGSYQGQTMQNNSRGIQHIDPYSYNGALVSKGGNYIPVTDDFSAFRK
jgi:hypothetical protein